MDSFTSLACWFRIYSREQLPSLSYYRANCQPFFAVLFYHLYIAILKEVHFSIL